MWLGTTIPGDIGNNLKSIHEFALRLDVINARLPARDRHTEDKTAERVLEQIMSFSSHLSQAAALELNGPVARRSYMNAPAGAGLIWTRDLRGIINYFGSLWGAAMAAGHIIKSSPTTRPSVESAHSAVAALAAAPPRLPRGG